MDSMWDTIKRNLRDGAAAAMNKADELTQLGRARLDVAVIKTRLNRLQAELGALAYGSIESGTGAELSASVEVRDLCGRIRAVEADLTSCQRELQELKDHLSHCDPDPDEGDPEEE